MKSKEEKKPTHKRIPKLISMTALKRFLNQSGLTLRKVNNYLNYTTSSIFKFSFFLNKVLPSGINIKIDIARLGIAPPELIFDVGANIGQTAFDFSHKFKKSKIISFEPFQMAFYMLKKNTENFNNVKIEKLALSNRIGTQKVKINKATNSVLNSLNDNIAVTNNKGQEETIDLTTIDQYCALNNINHIDLLKIDVEGHELQVLEGAVHLLNQKSISFILAEVSLHSSNVRNTSLVELIKVMEKNNFIFLQLYDCSHIQIYTKNHYGNALFISNHLLV